MFLTLLSSSGGAPPSGTQAHIKVAGVWELATVFIKVSGTWQPAQPFWKDGGVWN
jgi:hypothetical protein